MEIIYKGKKGLMKEIEENKEGIRHEMETKKLTQKEGYLILSTLEICENLVNHYWPINNEDGNDREV